MDSIYPSLSLYFNLILNSIRLPPTIVATFYVGKKVGRRTLYLWSGVILGLCNYLIAIGFIFNTNFLIITFLFVYMFIFSLLYTPINYAYPAEITPAPKITIANIFNQAAMAVSLLFPPILIQMMNGNGYVVFLFFGIYTTISLIYMYNSLIETKGKKYEEIIKAFWSSPKRKATYPFSGSINTFSSQREKRLINTYLGENCDKFLIQSICFHLFLFIPILIMFLFLFKKIYYLLIQI